MSRDFIRKRGWFRQRFGFVGQGRKAATARDRGLSALPSWALIGVDRLLAFFTYFLFITRFYLDFLTPELSSAMPKAMLCFAADGVRSNTKRRYYTKRRVHSPCQLRSISFLVRELPFGNAARETPVSRPSTILRVSVACPGTPSLEALLRAITPRMPRTRYRIGETEYPYFLTCTVAGWLPVFTRPEAVQIVFDCWDFLRQNRAFALYGYAMLKNHLHLIASAPDMTDAMKSFKMFTAKAIIELLKRHSAEMLLRQLRPLKLWHKTRSDYQMAAGRGATRSRS